MQLPRVLNRQDALLDRYLFEDGIEEGCLARRGPTRDEHRDPAFRGEPDEGFDLVGIKKFAELAVEIGEFLGTSASIVRNHYRRGIDKLRSEIGEIDR